MLIPFNNLFAFIKLKCLECTIDESHAIKHSMDVFNYAHKIFEVEKINHCEIIGQERIIYTAALLHDMCDDKYTDVEKPFSNKLFRPSIGSGFLLFLLFDL